MNKREENKYSMYKAVETVLSENRETIDSVPMFADSVNEFRVGLRSIEDLDNHYQSAGTGAAANKYEARDEVAEKIMQITGPLSVYARRIGDTNLESICGSSESKYRYNFRDTEVLQRARLIVQRVGEHLEHLAPYGITEQMISGLKAAVGNYDSAMRGKESRDASSVAAREGLSKAMGEVDEILKEEIDEFMKMYKNSKPVFANQYWAARVIKDS